MAGLVRDQPDLLPQVSPEPSKAEAWARRYIILPPPDDNFPDSLSSENIKSDSMSFLTSPIFMYLRINPSQYQP